MGWWSTCIMGGDTPYDVAGVIAELLGSRFDRMHMPDDWTPEEQRLVREHLDRYDADRLAEDLAKRFSGFDGDAPVALQVLGLLIISSGARLPESMRQRVLAACESDKWARDDERRTARIRQLREAVCGYAGTPTMLRQTGLLERMFGTGESD